MAGGAPLGTLQVEPDMATLVARLNSILQTIELRLQNSEKTITDKKYSVANVTADRDFDADAATLDELADVVGTLITDLKTAGRLP